MAITAAPFFCICAILYFIPTLPAQNPPPAVVANVDEVSLDMVIRDKKDKQASGLKPSDLRITDSGKPVKISGLHLVNGGVERAITLVFDRLDPSAARVARSAAGEVLRAASKGNVSFAVLKIEGRLRLIQGFTSDRDTVRKAVSSVTGGTKDGYSTRAQDAEKNLTSIAQTGELGGQKVSMIDRASARLMFALLQDSQRIGQDQHAKASLAAMLALARGERGFNGRKAVIVFSQGLPSTARDRMMLLSIVSAANRAGLSIYGVDVNALDQQASSAMMASVAMSNMSAAGQTGIAPPVTRGGPDIAGAMTGTLINEQMGRLELNGGASGAGALSGLSASTGGTYVPASSDVRRPFRRMMEDLGTYYEASFVPTADPSDGSFHPVTVQPVKKGLKIQAPSGYSVSTASDGLGILPFEVPLQKALDGTQLPADVPFRAAIVRIGNTPVGNVNSVIVETPLKDIEMQQDANTRLFSARISVMARIKDQAGVVIEKFSEDIPRQGALESQDKARSEAVTFQRHFAAPPGQYTLETAVMDRRSGKAGALRMNFEIPAPPAGPSLSDIVLVRRTDPLSEGSDPDEPLHYGNGRVVPDIGGVLLGGLKQISLFFVLHPVEHPTDKPKLEMEVTRDDESIGRVPLALRPDAGAGPIAYMASMNAATLQPGRYEAHAILTQDGNIAKSVALFTIDGPPTSAGSPKQLAMPEDVARERVPLVITSPPTVIPPPPADELNALLHGAAERATEYTNSIPNFMCIEVTHRSVDPGGSGSLRRRDTITELLRYHDKREQRVTVQVNGARSDLTRADFQGTITLGEFGGLLNAVFNAGSKADFHWKETAALGSGTVQVFDYRVNRANSQFGITGSNNHEIKVGFHGLVYIDSETYGVRRLALEAEGIPPDFPTRAAAMTIDYDYVSITDHEYLMPIAGTVRVVRGKRSVEQNEIEFRDYKRYGADSTIKFDDPK